MDATLFEIFATKSRTLRNMSPIYSATLFKKCWCPLQEFIAFSFYLFLPFIFCDILPVFQSFQKICKSWIPNDELVQK